MLLPISFGVCPKGAREMMFFRHPTAERMRSSLDAPLCQFFHIFMPNFQLSIAHPAVWWYDKRINTQKRRSGAEGLHFLRASGWQQEAICL